MTTKPQGKPLTPTVRNDKGQIIGGAANPGGMTKEQREARDAIRTWLSSEEMREEGKAAYLRLLKADNPVIVKDFMDRLAGKVKEHVEVTGDGPSVLTGLTREQLLAIARGEKPE